MPLYLGLDCGGSASRALMIDEQGNTVFQGRSGPANLASTPMKSVRKNVCRAVEGAPEPDAVCGCFAGLLTMEDRCAAESLLREALPAAKVRAMPDYCAAHLASEHGADFTVIAGTGSVVCSRIGGEFVKSGGRGFLLGDFGSAFRYGREALVAYLEDPNGASESLRKAVAKHLGSGGENELIARLYRGRSMPARVARLAPAFESDLDSGIGYAVEFLETESTRLAKVVAKHIGRYLSGRRKVKGSLAGGLWEISPRFSESLSASLREILPDPHAELVISKRPAVFGAVQLARELLDEH